MTDMESLFDVDYNSGAPDPLMRTGAWDTSGVTTMYRMFLQSLVLTRTSAPGRR